MGHVALVLDIDDSQIALVHILEQANLGFGIVFVRTVPCQMIVRDIEQNRYTRMELLCGGNLIARKLGAKPGAICTAIDLVNRRVANIANGNAGDIGKTKQMVDKRRSGGLTVGPRHRTPVARRKTGGKLGLAHNFVRMSTAGGKEVAKFRNSGAGNADVVCALDVLGAQNKASARTLKLASAIVGLRFCSTVHGYARYTVAQMGTCPLDNIETRRAPA